MRRLRIRLTLFAVFLALVAGCMVGILVSSFFVPARRGPVWPKREDIVAIKVDMRLWIKGNGRYTLEMQAVPQTENVYLEQMQREAFYVLRESVLEAVPVSTNSCTYESSGQIRLVLKDGSEFKLSTLREHYLAMVQNGKAYCMMFDAAAFEHAVWMWGKRAPLPQPNRSP